MCTPRMGAHFHWKWPPGNDRPSTLTAEKRWGSIDIGSAPPKGRRIARAGNSPATGYNPIESDRLEIIPYGAVIIAPAIPKIGLPF